MRFAPHRIQLQADSHRLSYARARVEVHEQMDGSIAIYYRQRRLMTQPAPAEAPILRIRHTRALPLPDAASTPAAEPSKRPAKTPLQKVAGRIRGHHPKKPDATHPWRRKTSITDDLNRLMRTEL